MIIESYSYFSLKLDMLSYKSLKLGFVKLIRTQLHCRSAARACELHIKSQNCEIVCELV